MAQAGIHGIVGMAIRKWKPNREWLMLGIVLGNLLPDADNLVLAVATITGLATEGLHRTFTHSLFTVIAIAFYIGARATTCPLWGSLGLGIGVLVHILLDLLIWFNGVALLWPIPLWVSLGSRVTPPEWSSKLMLPAEFLCFALFFALLDVTARKRGTDGGFLHMLRVWTVVQGILFVVLTVLVYTMEKGFIIPYGTLYLLSLGLAFGVMIRMGETVESDDGFANQIGKNLFDWKRFGVCI